MGLRLKIRLAGILILLIGFIILRLSERSSEGVEIPDIDAVPQLEPEYTINLESGGAQ